MPKINKWLTAENFKCNWDFINSMTTSLELVRLQDQIIGGYFINIIHLHSYCDIKWEIVQKPCQFVQLSIEDRGPKRYLCHFEKLKQKTYPQ